LLTRTTTSAALATIEATTVRPLRRMAALSSDLCSGKPTRQVEVST